MSKKIIAIGLAVVAIAVPFVAPVALGLAVGSFAALAVTAALEVGIALASSILIGPSVPKLPQTNPVDRLYANLDTTTPRKFVFGYTAAATDVRYQSYTGDNQELYHQIICLASHQVTSIDEIWIDNEMAWNGAVLGRYVGFLDVATNPTGDPLTPIPIDSIWTSNCKLSYCAYIYLRFTLIGPDEDTPSPFQTGISNRLTIRVHGAPMYDPRLDGTVTGGSGTQRASNQATWGTVSTNIRNPALQLLWFLLGWKKNNKLMVGMGIPPVRIDLPSFITAANVCDENVQLVGGGASDRYQCDGLLSEGDDRGAVIDQLCSSMNATLRDAGGKIALANLKDDLGSPKADFGLDDILGGEEWVQTPSLSNYFNVIRGRYVNATDNALYQLSDYPEVKVPSPDDIERIQAVDYPMIQSAAQAQRLAKLRLMRNQHQGRYSALFGPRAWQVSIGDVVRLTHAGLSFGNKVFRVAEQSIARTGETKMTLIEENALGYVWDAEESDPPVAPPPIVWDPDLSALWANLSFLVRRNRGAGLATNIATTTGVSNVAPPQAAVGADASTATASGIIGNVAIPEMIGTSAGVATDTAASYALKMAVGADTASTMSVATGRDAFAKVFMFGTPTFNTLSGTKAITAAATAERLPFCFTAHSTNSSANAPTDNHGDGGTWIAVEAATKTSGADALILWVRSKAWTSSISTTVTHNPGASQGGFIAVYEVSAVTKAGIAAIRQAAHQSSQASNTTPAPVLGGVPVITNPIIGAVFSGINSTTTVTPRASYTEDFDNGFATPAAGLELMHLNRGEASATITWGSQVSGAGYCSMVAEIDAS